MVCVAEQSRVGRTVVLKLKTSDSNILTRSLTPAMPPSSCDELTQIALALRERVSLAPERRYRLVGVGLSNFGDIGKDELQPLLFTDDSSYQR